MSRHTTSSHAPAIIGVVGAGGIGRDIYVAISLFHYQQLSTLLLMTLVVVKSPHGLSERLGAVASALILPIRGGMD
jgi:phosphonate transport system permease protein